MSPSFAIPYLLLVTFMTPLLSNPAIVNTRSLNDSPFDGIACKLRDALSIEPINEDAFTRGILIVKNECKKDIWPWIFFNRFVGHKPGNSAHANAQKYAKNFASIKGLDINNKTGALEDFFQVWQISLRVAKKLNSPGIVADTESYNNHKCEEVEFVASELGETPDEVRRKLLHIGGRLQDYVDEIYPEAILWFLSTELPNKIKSGFFTKEDHMTYTYIVLGMLERAKEKSSESKLVCGGMEVGYCQLSLDAMNKKINKRKETLREYLDRYSNFKLGGALGPWDKQESKKGFFLRRNECKNSEIKTIEDFQPLFEELLRTYDYVWMYASEEQGWYPYDRKTSIIFEDVLARAKTTQINTR